jgi:hypothetical protein
MDSIQRTGGALPVDGASKKAATAGGPAGPNAVQDSFSRTGSADPELEKQKILKDMIFSQETDPLHMVWCFDNGSPVVETPMSSPDGKTIYAACADSKIHAINTATGKEKWAASAEAGSMWDANATLSRDGTSIFITGQNGVLQCLDALKGEKKWEFDSGKHRGNFSRTVLRCGDRNECSSDGSTIFASLDRRQVSAFDVNTGEKKWDLETRTDTYGKPVLSNDEKPFLSPWVARGSWPLTPRQGRRKVNLRVETLQWLPPPSIPAVKNFLSQASAASCPMILTGAGRQPGHLKGTVVFLQSRRC